MKTLNDCINEDALALQHNTRLTPEHFRFVAAAGIQPFRETTVRPAIPVRVVNDPGVKKSREIKVVDIGDPEHGPEGTGGTYDRVDFSASDKLVYRIWKNIHVPWDIIMSSNRVEQLSAFQRSGEAAGEKVAELENKMLIGELGPHTGLTKTTGTSTFAGGNWTTTPEDAFNDVVKAVMETLPTEKIPTTAAAIAVHPKRRVNLETVANIGGVVNTVSQRLQPFLPGGIHSSIHVPETEAWVYQRSPRVLEYLVYQDRTVIPLPMTDEDQRMRVRVAGVLHVYEPKGLVKITAVTS